MNARLLQELQQLSTAEKRALGEALIVSADSEASAPSISGEQRSELLSRLAHHRANPAEIGVDFSQLKANILGASK
jgi:putative addiction module component (TIGR02574 family)